MADDDAFDFNVDLVAEGDKNAFHVPNLPGEDFRRVLAQTTSEKPPLHMRIKIVEVHHGKMVHEDEECEATLIVFEFRFQSRVAGHRYRSVSVSLDFLDKGNNARRDPVLVDLAPDRMHWLNKTAYDRRTKLSTSAGISGGSSGVASADAKVGWEMEQTRPLKFQATLTGNPGRSYGKAGEENSVTWTMQENHDAADGVPAFLQTAVLLKRVSSAPFKAVLRVHSVADFKSAGLRAFPVTSDKDRDVPPVVITPDKVQVRNNKASGLTPADLESMETIVLARLFRVNLSEQDDLTPGKEAAADATGTAGAADEAAGREATKEGEAGEGATRTATTTSLGLSLDNGEGADGGEEDGSDDEAGANDGSDDADTGATALPVPSFSFHVVQTTTTHAAIKPPTAAPAPAPEPAPALERTLPLPNAPTALAPATPPPSTSALAPPAAVMEALASAAAATQYAAKAADAAAQAAIRAADASSAASSAAEALIKLLSQLGLK